MHPYLVADSKSTSGYVRAGTDKSEWRLPDRAQLAAWQNERNALEDEVNRFDDGDMERMKQKTRGTSHQQPHRSPGTDTAVLTRMPLTQPSTDLVEVTLELIVIIDHLHTLLRDREALLELTALRLQWDDLRFEATRESASVKFDIDHVVEVAQAWMPGAPALDSRSNLKAPVPSKASSSSQGSSLTDALLQTPAGSNAAVGVSPMRQLTPSPVRSASKSALHISILRSQLVGLQTRHRNYAFNLVKRASTVLDRMIDAAGRMKELGGIEGPMEDEANRRKGAVPEAFIEIQESLEEDAKDIGERVTWCSLFEGQSKKAHEYYVACNHSRHLAGQFLTKIELALAEPASSFTHAELNQLFKEASDILPAEIDDTFPRPTHASFPTKDQHNKDVESVLRAVRKEAQDELDIARKALTFYSSLLKARESLQAQQNRVKTLRHQLHQTLLRFEQGVADAPRPSLEDVAMNGETHAGWLAAVPDWIDSGDLLVRAASDTQEATTLALMQYRKALQPPMAVKKLAPDTGVPDDLGTIVNDDASDLIDVARRCANLASSVKTDHEALPIILGVRRDNSDVSSDVEELRKKLIGAVNRAAWSSRTSVSAKYEDLDDELQTIVRQAEGAGEELSRLEAIIGNRLPVTMPLKEASTANLEGIDAARRDLGILSRVTRQAKAVASVSSEAAEHLVTLDSARDAISASNDSINDALDNIANIKIIVTEWSDGIARRVPLVSGNSSGFATPRRPSSGPLTPPLTPVGTERDFDVDETTMIDLEMLDDSVRSEINRQSSRVTAALTHLLAASEEIAFKCWTGPVKDATATLSTHSATLRGVIDSLRGEVAGARNADEDAVLDLAKEIQSSALGKLTDPTKDVQEAIGDLNEALSADAHSSVNIQRAADVFSSADDAREEGLNAIAAAEELRTEVDQFVLESELAAETRANAAAAPAPEAPSTPKLNTSQTRNIKALSDKLGALELEAIVHPTPESLKKTPKHRRLPSTHVAKSLTATFASISNNARALAKKDPNQSPDMARLLDEVNRQGALVPDLGGLASVGDAVAACDKAFSKLLDGLDSGNTSTCKKLRDEAASAVKALHAVSEPHASDIRVKTERQRIARAWADLRGMADGEAAPPSAISSSVVSSSVVDSDSTARTPEPGLARRRVSSASRSTYSFASTGPGPSSRAHSIRSRFASGGAPSPRPQESPAPRRARKSAPPIPSPSPARSRITTTVPQPFRLSRSNSGSSLAAVEQGQDKVYERPPRRPRKSLAPGPRPKPAPRNINKLDAAVRQVLDTLDVNISVVAAGDKDSDKWHDESGRYWIGTGPKARLCFCRILRSRTVMVRVGGGWVELGRYLIDRCADQLGDVPELPEVEEPQTPSRVTDLSTSPIALTSSSLSAARRYRTFSSARSTVSSSISGISGRDIRTPSRPRASLPLFSSELGLGAPSPETPRRVSAPLSHTTPESLGAGLPGGPGSPLVPIQFIRKASESPSVRNKEREQLSNLPGLGA